MTKTWKKMTSLSTTKRNLLTGILVCSLVGSTLPAAAQTPSGSTAGAQTSESDTFRASLDRAAASLVALPSAPVQTLPGRGSARSAESLRQAAGGGGGMSKAAIATTIIGVVAGAAGTYYMVKQLRSIQSSIPTIPTVPPATSK
jgi:hypothetical protein